MVVEYKVGQYYWWQDKQDLIKFISKKIDGTYTVWTFSYKGQHYECVYPWATIKEPTEKQLTKAL